VQSETSAIREQIDGAKSIVIKRGKAIQGLFSENLWRRIGKRVRKFRAATLQELRRPELIGRR
jgi:hypothetical protein